MLQKSFLGNKEIISHLRTQGISSFSFSFFTMKKTIQTHKCWFANSEASSVKSETGLSTWRSRRNLRKRQIPPDWQVAVLISEGIYKPCLLWLQDEQVSILPARIVSLCRGLNWVQSHSPSRRSQQRIALSRLCP